MTEDILEYKTEQHLLAGTDTVRAEAQVVGPEGRQLRLTTQWFPPCFIDSTYGQAQIRNESTTWLAREQKGAAAKSEGCRSLTHNLLHQ